MQNERAAVIPRLGIRESDKLAHAVSMPLSALREIAANAERFYHSWPEKKSSGGSREIDSPLGRLRLVQSRIYQRLLASRITSRIAAGGVKGRSHLLALPLHAGKDIVATLDVKDFFPSVTPRHVCGLFLDMGCSPEVARLLTRLTTVRNRLPQGAPTSTAVANLLLADLDKHMEAAASALGTSVSRCVDDIAISGSRTEVGMLLDLAIRALHRKGLHIHRGKLVIRPSSMRQTVNHLVVNQRPTIPKRRQPNESGGLSRDELRQEVRWAHRHGISLRDRRSLLGRISYAEVFHPAEAARLRARLSGASER